MEIGFIMGRKEKKEEKRRQEKEDFDPWTISGDYRSITQPAKTG